MTKTTRPTLSLSRLMGRISHLKTHYADMLTIQGIVFINLVGFGLLVPLLPFFAKTLTADPWQVTLMFSAYSTGQFIAEPILGRMSDRWGRKPILFLTTMMTALFYIALAFAPTIWWAILVRFLCGLSAGNISTIQGYVADVSTPENKAARLATIGAAFSLGFIVGPAIGGGLGTDSQSHDAFRLPLFVAAGMSALASVCVFLALKESVKKSQNVTTSPSIREAFKVARSSPVIGPVILTTMAYAMAFAGLDSTFGLWAEAKYGWGSKEVGAVFLFIGIAAVVMQIFMMHPLIRRYGEFKVLSAGVFFFGASFALQVINSLQWMIIPIVMLGTLGQAVIFSTISAIISHATPPDRQGAMLGFNMSAGAIGRIFGPIFAGLLFSFLGRDAPIWMGACLCMPAALLALYAEKRQKSSMRLPQ